MNIIVVIPAYNEEKTVGHVIQQINMLRVSCLAGRQVCFVPRVIVVDDGSSDNTAQVAREAGAQVFSHAINRGLGAAIATGIEAALQLLHNPPQPSLTLREGEEGVIVTLDADLQHNPKEIFQVIEPIVKREADVVIGSRWLHTKLRKNTKVTKNFSIFSSEASVFSYELRHIANWCGNFATWFLCGLWITDSQSGFRAFSAQAARQLRLRTSTMEVSSEIIREIVRLKLRFKQIPITVSYTEYSLSKAHGQSFLHGLDTLWKLIVLKFFR